MRVVIVDDEPFARDRLARLLEQRAGVSIVGTCADGATAVETIRVTRPDLVLLDVQMPDMDGFAVLAALGHAFLPLVIFVTAYDDYALTAFRVHALDYLLKPVDPERLDDALTRAASSLADRARAHDHDRIIGLLETLQRSHQHLEQAMDETADRPLDWLTVPAADGLRLVRTADIDWIDSAGNYVRVHIGKDTFLVRTSIARLASQLDARTFRRSHRGVIVNLSRIRELQRWFSGEMVILLKDGTRLKLSRHFRDSFFTDLSVGQGSG